MFNRERRDKRWCLSACTLNRSRLFVCISACNDSSFTSAPNKEGASILFSVAVITARKSDKVYDTVDFFLNI